MKRNYITLHNLGIVISPKKMNVFRFIPITFLRIGLSVIFQSDFGRMFMYQHSIKAPDEMRQLHRQFYKYIKTELDRWNYTQNMKIKYCLPFGGDLF